MNETIDEIIFEEMKYLGPDNLRARDAFRAGVEHPEIGQWTNRDFKGRMRVIEPESAEVDLVVDQCPGKPATCPFRYHWSHYDKTPYVGCHAVHFPDGFYWRKYFHQGGSLRCVLCKEQ